MCSVYKNDIFINMYIIVWIPNILITNTCIVHIYINVYEIYVVLNVCFP